MVNRFFKKNIVEILLVIFTLIFSFWLMFETFSYDQVKGEFLIPLKPWGDFSSHIPIIRSFSLGSNFPPEYPLFPGEPMRYHFLFYFVVGTLEKIGLRIDWALNLPSILSFFFLLMVIYFLAKTLFNSKFVGIISVLLFLFNGSLSFFYFFEQHPLSFIQTISDILNNDTFPAFAPYDKTLISGGFWNLNVFTNQRHLASALTITLLLVYSFVKNEKREKILPIKLVIIYGIFVGILSFLHGAAFIMAGVIILSLFFLFPRQRKVMFTLGIVAILISLPRIVFLWQIESSEVFKFNPGYLVANNLSFLTWFLYWLLNLGIGFLLIPLGFILSNTLAKKVFIAFATLFLIGNLFQFSPDIATNHKFFNLWLIIGNMFIAFVLIILWKRGYLQKVLVTFLLLFLMLSGIIDLFPIKNDQVFRILDYPKSPDIAWIVNNTSKDAVFLNSTYLYHPASLAGRKIFLGWPYYPWSLGYDTISREALLKRVYNTENLAFICSFLKKQHISYIAVDKNPDPQIIVNTNFLLKMFEVVYKNEKSGFIVLNPRERCSYDY